MPLYIYSLSTRMNRFLFQNHATFLKQDLYEGDYQARSVWTNHPPSQDSLGAGSSMVRKPSNLMSWGHSSLRAWSTCLFNALATTRGNECAESSEKVFGVWGKMDLFFNDACFFNPCHWITCVASLYPIIATSKVDGFCWCREAVCQENVTYMHTKLQIMKSSNFKVWCAL